MDRKLKGLRGVFGVLGAMVALFVVAAPASAQSEDVLSPPEPRDCEGQTIEGSCVDDPTPGNQGFVFLGGDEGGPQGEFGLCLLNEAVPTGAGYYFLAGPTAATGDAAADCPVPPDGDGDGTPDDADNCPTVAGPASNSGCPVPPPVDAGGGGDQTPAPSGDPTPSGDPSPTGPPVLPAPPIKGDPIALSKCLKKAKKIDNRKRRKNAVRRCNKLYGG